MVKMIWCCYVMGEEVVEKSDFFFLFLSCGLLIIIHSFIRLSSQRNHYYNQKKKYLLLIIDPIDLILIKNFDCYSFPIGKIKTNLTNFRKKTDLTNWIWQLVTFSIRMTDWLTYFKSKEMGKRKIPASIWCVWLVDIIISMIIHWSFTVFYFLADDDYIIDAIWLNQFFLFHFKNLDF